MRVVLAGGSGFLGRALHTRLQREGHTIAILTRRPRPTVREDVAWTPDGSAGPWASALDGIDAIVNLSGEGIADRRWNEDRKRALRSSRLLSTRSVVAAIRLVQRPPAALVNASAVGYYGAHGDEFVTEATPPGSDFLSDLCVQWEREAEQASSLTRVTRIRTAPVLDSKGGALRKMLLPFRLGIGGPLGTGTQFMPWIHIDDWVDLVIWLMTRADAHGAFNATAPNPVTNREFARALGRALSRPAFVPVPAFALRVLLGELATSLLTGQRAIPARAVEMGFAFRFNEIEPALRDLLH